MKPLEAIAKEAPLNTEQLKKIESYLLKNGNFSRERIRKQIDLVCNKIGLDFYYFKTTPLREIARLIESIRAAEIISELDHRKEVDIDLRSERRNSALYVGSDIHEKAIRIERIIEEKYPLHRIHSYRTLGSLLDTHLRIVLVTEAKYEGRQVREDEDDLHKIAGKGFFEAKTRETRERYQNFVRRAGRKELYMEFSEREETDETRLMILMQATVAKRFFSAISDVINYYGIYTNVKYFEPFAHGKVAMSFYFNRVNDLETLENIKEDISLISVLPENKLTSLFREGRLSVQEMCYGAAAANFTHQFVTDYSSEYAAIANELKDNPEIKGTVEALRYSLLKAAYSEDRVFETLKRNTDVLKTIYRHFESKFLPGVSGRDLIKIEAEVEKQICRRVEKEMDRRILRFLLSFNNQTLKTNFYHPEKRALSFRLSPDFLATADYPEKPYGIFFILGAEFKGFHVRFRDVARGGVRIVRSADHETYEKNSDMIFDENYNLARTQHYKNKDIPEGGSKGTLILHPDSQDKSDTAFKKYIDGLLDLIIPNASVKDYLGREEILFLGPDEGTADLMDWASFRAQERGYSFWKAFSTGKSLKNGGIPHDIYGMTTHSVHQYALKIMEKMGLSESRISKFQTGGPDGDLGSNEILISKDKTVAIVDGSGVAYDPEGLNRRELKKLAGQRRMIRFFDRSKLSSKGYVVVVNEHNVKLPNGEIIPDGTVFRNTFHLRKDITADFFIPCGGRPKSIHIGNWTDLLDEQGRLRFKYFVEGANLFITQAARLRLEEKGAVVYKDASANKGGVTSSSLEVFASLALNDDEYEKYLCVKNGRAPAFRKKYVSEVLSIIRQNAVYEFDLIWREQENSGMKRSILTDVVSAKINDLTDEIQCSSLYENKRLRRRVIGDHCPPVLLKTCGLDHIFKRVPEIYLRAVFASHLASRYVYSYGLNSSEIKFLSFIESLDKISA